MLKKNFLLAITGIALLLGGIATAHAATETAMTKAEVQKIVQEYIETNPEAILDSIQKYQDNVSREKQEGAIKANEKDLFSDSTPFAGNKNGDVTIVEFFDYNCGYCKKVLPPIEGLLESDKNVRVLFKEFPILGDSSEAAAKWALAAHKQGKYFAFHKSMMENKSPINDALLEKVAKNIGMDIGKAKADVESADILLQIKANRNLAVNMQISGTPAFIIGGEIVPGAIDLDALKEMIANQRKKTK